MPLNEKIPRLLNFVLYALLTPPRMHHNKNYPAPLLYLQLSIMSPIENILPQPVRNGIEWRNILNYDGTSTYGLDVIYLNVLNDLQQEVGETERGETEKFGTCHVA